MKKPAIDYAFNSTLVLVFSAAVILHLWVTNAGIGIQGDASPYILTARSLRAGQGFYILDEPMAIWAPFYPILLALWSNLGTGIESAARYLHTIAYGLNAVLFMVIIYISTGRNLSASVVGAVFFLSSAVILFVHSIAWSESPFVLFVLISCILLQYFLRSGRIVYLILSSLSIGLAIATRYVGVSLLPPAVLITFFMLKKPLGYRIKAVAGMTAIAVTPILIWTIRNQLVVGSLADRALIYHPRNISTLVTSFVNVFHGFILSDLGSKHAKLAEFILIALILVFIAFVLFKHRKKLVESDPNGVGIVIFGILFTFSYIAVLLTTIFLLDAAVPVDNRLLFPVLVFIPLTVIPMVYLYSRTVKRPVIWIIFFACIIFSIRSNAPGLIAQARAMHSSGIGFNAYHWQNSALMSFLLAEKPTSKIYSNGYNVIPVLTGINAYTLPEKFFNNTLLDNLQFEQEMQALCQEVKSSKAVVIYIEEVSKKNLPEEEQLLELCSLPVLMSVGDGTIYGYNLHGIP